MRNARLFLCLPFCLVPLTACGDGEGRDAAQPSSPEVAKVVTAEPSSVAETKPVREAKKRRVMPKKVAKAHDSEEEEPSFASMMKSVRVLESIAERRKAAERAMADDPAAAVVELVQLAALTKEDLGYMRATLEAWVGEWRAMLAQKPDSGQSFVLGRTLFELGRFEEAETALREALELGLAKREDQVAALCWAGAAARVTGAEARATDDVARAAKVVEQRRDEAKLAAAQQARDAADRKQAAADRAAAKAAARRRSTPSDVSNTTTTWDDLLRVGVGTAPAQRTGASRAQQDYLSAAAAYEAEQARYDAERDWAQQSAGRLGALGIQGINPRPVDQAVYTRYLNARQAYDASRGGY